MQKQRNQIVVGIFMTMVAVAPISLATTDDSLSSPREIIAEMVATLANLIGIETCPEPYAEESQPANDPNAQTDESGGMPDPYG